MTSLQQRLNRVREADFLAETGARARLDQLTKPPGSLGELEEVAVRVAALIGGPPSERSPAILIFAADHGVAGAGVSAYPQSVTAQMLANFARGGAAINAIAATVDAPLVVADLGVIDAAPDLKGVRRHPIGPGTRDFTRESAMTREQAEQSIDAGATIAEEAIASGANLLALGEMGIANTTSAAAITAAILGRSAADTVGPGTGLDDVGLVRKRNAVHVGVERCPDTDDPLGVLAEVGGFEIGAMVGAMLAAAAARVPVILDGYICGAAALIAASLAPHATAAMIAGHLSPEPGHALILERLELRPLLQLEMRLGEASGAALAIPLVLAALRVFTETATFEEAQVDGPSA